MQPSVPSVMPHMPPGGMQLPPLPNMPGGPKVTNLLQPVEMPASLMPAAAPTAKPSAKVRAPGLVLAPPNTEVLKRRKTLRASVVIAASLVVAVIGSIMLLNTYTRRDLRGAEAVGNSFMAAVQANNANDAYNQTTSSFQKTTSNLQLAQIEIQFNEYIGKAKMTLDASNVAKTSDGTRAALVYKGDANNKTYYVRVGLVKQSDGSWQVQNFRLSQKPLNAEITESE